MGAAVGGAGEKKGEECKEVRGGSAEMTSEHASEMCVYRSAWCSNVVGSWPFAIRAGDRVRAADVQRTSDGATCETRSKSWPGARVPFTGLWSRVIAGSHLSLALVTRIDLYKRAPT